MTDTTKPTNLAALVMLYRAVNRITLRDLGKRIGIGASTLMRVEQGRAMDAATLMLIMRWLTNAADQWNPGFKKGQQ